MRKKIFETIERSEGESKLSSAYDFLMMGTIIVSLIPLLFKESNIVFDWIDYISVSIFILDYLLRLITADFKLQKSALSFLIYPFMPMSIIDLLSILPSVTMLNSAFKLFKLFRLLRCLKVLRTLKMLRYSRSFEIIVNVFKKQQKILSAVGTLALAYILVSALIIFNVEPELFETFFDALYWATVSLTTVGYGDICPVSAIGRFVTMVSAVLGVAIIALPASVITAGYMTEIKGNDNKEE